MEYYQKTQWNLKQQINTSVLDPASFLHLVSVVIFQWYFLTNVRKADEVGILTFVSGKYVPTILKFLQNTSTKGSDFETLVKLCIQYQKLVIQWIKSGKEEKNLTELENKKKDIISLLEQVTVDI